MAVKAERALALRSRALADLYREEVSACKDEMSEMTAKLDAAVAEAGASKVLELTAAHEGAVAALTSELRGEAAATTTRHAAAVAEHERVASTQKMEMAAAVAQHAAQAAKQERLLGSVRVSVERAAGAEWQGRLDELEATLRADGVRAAAGAAHPPREPFK